MIVEPVRRYTGGDVLSHILGYTGRVDEEDYADAEGRRVHLDSDRIGKAGVEAAYEEYLRGTVGRKEIEKDATGRELRTLAETPRRPGNDLVLSIDLDLQKKATELTQAAANGGQAAAIVMDVHSGEVLALVSLPMYDNNVFSGKIDEARLEQYLDDPKKPLVNHALAEQYAPGSIFKQITGAAALQEGVAVPSTTITSNGFINSPEPVRPVDRLHLQGLARRSGRWTSTAASRCPPTSTSTTSPAAITPTARTSMGSASSGLRDTRGSSASDARRGSISPARPTATSRTRRGSKKTFGDDWVLGDTYNMGIGQGFVAATPIQMVRVVAAVANGGTLLTPRVVREVLDAQRHVIVPPSRRSKATLGQPGQPGDHTRGDEAGGELGQREARRFLPDLEIAGKTGTAEFGPRFADGSYETHAWFSGFAPADDPQLAITVFLERGVGATNAAPLASKILDYYFHRTQPSAYRRRPAAPQAG